MDFSLTKEQEDIKRAAAEFARGEFLPELALDCELNHRFPRELFEKAAKLGFIGLDYPESLGGGVQESSVPPGPILAPTLEGHGHLRGFEEFLPAGSDGNLLGNHRVVHPGAMLLDELEGRGAQGALPPLRSRRRGNGGGRGQARAELDQQEQEEDDRRGEECELEEAASSQLYITLRLV